MTASAVVGPTAWLSADLTDHALVLDASGHATAIREAIASASAAGETAADVDPERPGLDPFVTLAAAVDARLAVGPGLAIVRGLAIHETTDPVLATWLLARGMGPTQPQDAAGSRVRIVEPQAHAPGHAVPGGSTGANRILLHTENARPPRPPGVVVLGCLNQSPTGGWSTLCSAHALYNRLLTGSPDVIDRLFAPFQFGRHEEDHPDGQRLDLSPVLWWEGGRLRMRYSRYWIDIATRATGRPLDPEGERAASAIDVLLDDPELVARRRLEPGDVLVFDNQTVLHGRDGFDPGDGQRRLVRAWVEGPPGRAAEGWR